MIRTGHLNAESKKQLSGIERTSKLIRMNISGNNHHNSISVDDKNCEVFLNVLSDFLVGNNTSSVNEVDWRQFTRLARIHKVEGIIYHQCKDCMPPDILASFEKDYYATLFYYKNREKMTSEIVKEFMNCDIPSFEVKGMEVSKYFPIPSLRTMGDSDIVVHEQDRERAISTLYGLGFAFDHEYTGKERVYSRNGMNVEIHHSLIYDEVINVLEQELFFSRCWDYVRDGKLDNNFHFLYLILHLRKHMLNSGAGFRQFMDIAAVTKNDSRLDWNWIEEKLYETKLLRFAQTCFGLIDYWFDIRIPMEYPLLDQEFIKLATRKIRNNGVFGFDDNSNMSNSVTNQMRRFKGPRWLFRVLTLFKRLFPGYRFLRISEDYEFLDGRPWLLPVAWCRRFYLMSRGRKTSAGESLKQIMTPNRIVNLREKELKQWGLID